MSEDTDFQDEENFEEEVSETRNPAREHQRKLERELKDSKAREKASNEQLAEANAAKRELALMKAGIDVASGQGKLFAKAYDGDLTVEAIKAQAEEYGLIPTSQTAEIKEELAATQRVASASTGTAGFTPPDAVSEFKATTTPAEVIALARKHGIPISDEQPGAIYSIV